MVKVSYEDFVSKVDKFFIKSKEKNTLYFTFKRYFPESYKFKKNQKIKKLRRYNQLVQEREASRLFSILIRIKLNKKKFFTILEPNEIEKFHNIFIKIMSLHFIISLNENKTKTKILKTKLKKRIINKIK